jgi:hypothetical protein
VKVSSPVGDYPYEVTGVSFRGGHLVVAGRLGVWETTMEVEPADFAAIGRRALRPLALLAMLGAAAAAAGRLPRLR